MAISSPPSARFARRDRAAVQLRHARRDREPDALAVLPVVAALVGAIERLEDPLRARLRGTPGPRSRTRTVALPRRRHRADLDRLRAIAVDQRIAHDVLDRRSSSRRRRRAARPRAVAASSTRRVGILEARVVDDLADERVEPHDVAPRRVRRAQARQAS